MFALGAERGAVLGLYEVVRGDARRRPSHPTNPQLWPWNIRVYARETVPPWLAIPAPGVTCSTLTLERVDDEDQIRDLYLAVNWRGPRLTP